MEQSLDRSSLPDQVFHRLAADVLSGRYAPGERLPTQRALAASLGVNMASVREGIKRLEQLRLVDVRQGDAMRVRDWRAHGGLDVLVHALGGGAALDREVMRSVMEGRRLLLADAARLAAEHRDDEQAALLARLAAEVAAADGDEAAQGADFAFFATLIAASGNLVLLLVANSIRELYFARLEEFRALVRDRAALAGLYASAAEAVAAGDAEAAARSVGELAAAQEAAWLEGLS
jgi:DNA-binding FadR family transcriptional regulator